ncbi:MAG: spore maturation protein [Bacteroidia bacterium]|nr:spore maturation protein [Bacteroidia bacterium]
MALSRVWSYLILFSIVVACYQYFKGDKNIFNDVVIERKLKDNETFGKVQYSVIDNAAITVSANKLAKANWHVSENVSTSDFIVCNNAYNKHAALQLKLETIPIVTTTNIQPAKFGKWALLDVDSASVDTIITQVALTNIYSADAIICNHSNTDSIRNALIAKLNQQKIITAHEVALYLPKNIDGIFETAKFAITVVIGLIGILALFMGLLNIAEQAGGIHVISRFMSPFLHKLFPTIPAGHASYGHMVMNFSANILGLDNAATPFGLKAMQSLQEINPAKEKASDAQIMFLALHASGLTLIPVSIIAVRAANGSHNPNEVFIPLILSTFVCTITALVVTSIKQRINLFQAKLFLPLAAIFSLLAIFVWYLKTLPPHALSEFSDAFSNGAILAVIALIVFGGLYKRINLFDAFVDGAKGGFDTAVRIIPYMVGMLVAVSMLRTSGAFDLIIIPIKNAIAASGMDTQWAEGLPVALLRPFSAGGARGFMIDAMRTYGADSFVGKLVSVLQGSSETTFYVVALYFGSVSVKDTRYAIPVMLLADLAGVLFSIFICYYLFA